MICGKLHDEGRGLAGEHSCFLEHDAGYDYCRHADEIRGGRDECAAAEECPRNHSDKGHLSAAWDEGRGHYRHAAVTLVFDGAGCHDTGHTAADADEHRDKALAGKTELAEDTVEYKGDTRHIAAGLKEGQHQKQHQHLRHKAEHRAHTGDNTVKDKPAQPVRRVRRLKPRSNEHRDAGDPHAVVGRVGSVKAVFLEIGDGVQIAHGHRAFLVRVRRDGVIVRRHVVYGESFLVLDSDDRAVGLGREGLGLGECRIAVKVLCLGVYL